ncbi:ribosome hibernation-promoting factor, HPF/YfiA family, partial [Candidatus Omnitrophota bacterium]
MNFSVTQKNIKVDDEVTTFLKEKLGKLDKKFQVKINTVSVILAKKKYLFYTEIRMQAKNLNVIGEGESDVNIYAAIEQGVNKAETQLKKHKEKIKKRNSKESLAHKEEFQLPDNDPNIYDAEEDVQSNSILDKIESEKRILKPMSVEEALLQMDMISEKLFDIFINSKTSEMNVIYRKSDGYVGNIGAM